MNFEKELREIFRESEALTKKRQYHLSEGAAHYNAAEEINKAIDNINKRSWEVWTQLRKEATEEVK